MLMAIVILESNLMMVQLLMLRRRLGPIHLGVYYAVVASPAADLDRGCLVFVRGGLCVGYGRHEVCHFLAICRLPRSCSRLRGRNIEVLVSSSRCASGRVLV